LVIASVRLPREQLRALVVTMVEELGVAVVLATDTSDPATIGEAVMAGARPVLDLAYDSARVAAEVHAHDGRTPAAVLRVGRLGLLRESLGARIDAVSLDLGPSEFEVLYLLAERADRAVARAALTAGRRLGSTRGENATTALVQRVRRKLEMHGAVGAVETV